jgi:hypothetical protein
LAADPRAYPEAGARFLRGARLAVQSQNDHTARILDLGTLESGTPYVVAELQCRERRLQLTFRLECVLEISAG